MRLCGRVDPDFETGVWGAGAAAGSESGIAGGGGKGARGDAEQSTRAASSGTAAIKGEGGGGMPDVRDAWVSGLHLWRGKLTRIPRISANFPE